MKYVFDTGVFIDLFRYYDKEVFPTLWENFDELLSSEQIVSVREARREIEIIDDALNDWAKRHTSLFHTPNEHQIQFIREKFSSDSDFRGLVRHKNIVKGGPVADPFIIALANEISGCVVTQERKKPDAPRIPNTCEKYNIECVDLIGFMRKEKWQF